MHQLWNGIAQNYKDRFWWHLAQIFETIQNRVCMLQFSCKFAFFYQVFIIQTGHLHENKHTNSILEYFEYFCQMSSKSILIILSYTVSKLVHFLRHTVVALIPVIIILRSLFIPPQKFLEVYFWRPAWLGITPENGQVELKRSVWYVFCPTSS